MKLEKAFDLKALAEAAKVIGLDLGEETAKQLVVLILDFVDQSVALTPNPMDDLARVITGPLKPLILSQLDKLDGQVG